MRHLGLQQRGGAGVGEGGGDGQPGRRDQRPVLLGPQGCAAGRERSDGGGDGEEVGGREGESTQEAGIDRQKAYTHTDRQRRVRGGEGGRKEGGREIERWKERGGGGGSRW